MGENTTQEGSVEDRIHNVLAEKFDRPKDGFTNETSIRNDLGADSLDEVELTQHLEDEFDGLKIPEEKAIEIKTVGDIIRCVNELLPKKPT